MYLVSSVIEVFPLYLPAFHSAAAHWESQWIDFPLPMTIDGLPGLFAQLQFPAELRSNI